MIGDGTPAMRRGSGPEPKHRKMPIATTGASIGGGLSSFRMEPGWREMLRGDRKNPIKIAAETIAEPSFLLSLPVETSTTARWKRNMS